MAADSVADQSGNIVNYEFIIAKSYVREIWYAPAQMQLVLRRMMMSLIETELFNGFLFNGLLMYRIVMRWWTSN